VRATRRRAVRERSDDSSGSCRGSTLISGCSGYTLRADEISSCERRQSTSTVREGNGISSVVKLQPCCPSRSVSGLAGRLRGAGNAGQIGRLSWRGSVLFRGSRVPLVIFRPSSPCCMGSTRGTVAGASHGKPCRLHPDPTNVIAVAHWLQAAPTGGPAPVRRVASTSAACRAHGAVVVHAGPPSHRLDSERPWRRATPARRHDSPGSSQRPEPVASTAKRR